MTPIFFESIYPKASKKGRKKIFGVQKFDFLTFQFFHQLHKKAKSMYTFYILSETGMLRNDYFHGFFKNIVWNSPSIASY